jgi:hypothetical protein
VKQPSVEVRLDDLCARKMVAASSVDGLFTVGKDFKSKATVRASALLTSTKAALAADLRSGNRPALHGARSALNALLCRCVA